MQMESIFINEKEQIKKIINSISNENCIAQYFKFLNFDFTDKKYVGSFEKDFCYKLNKRKKDFIAKIIEIYLYEISHEKLIKIACTFKMKRVYNFENAIENNEEEGFVKDHITDKDFFPLLIKEMKSALDELLEEKEKHFKNRVKKETERQIKYLKEMIERNKKNLEYYEAKIKKINEEKEK